MRKKIAVLVAQIDETTQKRFLTEFIRQSYEYDYDVCIFTMYQKYQETALRNIGDSNIFELVNCALFDAIVILGDTILTPGLIGPLQEKIKREFDGPVLVFDLQSPMFESVIMDHYTPVRRIIDHLIEVHGYTDIAFLGGKEGHPHSVQRLDAYLDSMKAHNLPVKEGRIYHGNYWYDSAEAYVDILLEDREHLPEALACANDIMAIGAAARLTENGVRVPEDIAITGYDSIADGRYSPKPVTSANIPADECGEYCATWIYEAINNMEHKPFVSKSPVFVGGSCGCKFEIEVKPKKLREQWRNQHSSRSLFSDFNHYLEDLLTQTSLQGFWQTLLDYSYQIRPFNSFDVCLNEGFDNPNSFVGEKAMRHGYADNIYRVLSCGSDEETKGSIAFDRKFSVKELIPGLTDERPYPTTFIFNPLYFDDRCFGYTVLNYGTEVRTYDTGYRVWMRNIMQGMEAFYRQGYMLALVEKIKADQVRDSLTGLYNYQGFIKYAQDITSMLDENRQKVNIITIDIKGTKQINEIYGRSYGDKAIMAVARIIQNSLFDEEISCRMGNDEFLIAICDDNESSRAESIKKELVEKVDNIKLIENSEYKLEIRLTNLLGKPEKPGDLEALINQTVSIKNHKKMASNQKSMDTRGMMDEIKRNQLVMNILNDNLLTYYYQPIVRASDGSVYAYEALMRYEKEKITPPQIIQAARYMNRLSDIERCTLLNVTRDVEENLEAFGNAKVFINSLPGVELSEQDDAEFSDRLSKHKGRFVIEFTEESELDDSQLEILKTKYSMLGNEIAIDDYGAGYSNVNNLLRYMPQYVKIDRMLLSDIHKNPQKQHFVRSIIEFTHDNNFFALAEGVETKEELQECIRLGVDLIQGFYTGKPKRKPVGEIDAEIRNEIERAYHQNISWQPVGNRLI